MTTENTDTNTNQNQEIDWTNPEAREAFVSSRIEALQKKNTELLNEKKSLKSDQERLKSFEVAAAQAEEQKMLQAGEFEKVRERDKLAHQKALDESKSRHDHLLKTLESKIIDSEAISAIASNDGYTDLLLPHVKSRVRMEEKDGKFVPIVLDAEGLPTEMNISELVKLMSTEDRYLPAFKSTTKAGGGTTSPNGTKSTANNPYASGSFNLTEIAKLEKNNPALAKQLQAQAGK